jgi:hypothetical protein
MFSNYFIFLILVLVFLLIFYSSIFCFLTIKKIPATIIRTITPAVNVPFIPGDHYLELLIGPATAGCGDLYGDGPSLESVVPSDDTYSLGLLKNAGKTPQKGAVWEGYDFQSPDQWKLGSPAWVGTFDGGEGRYIVEEVGEYCGDTRCQFVSGVYLGGSVEAKYSMEGTGANVPLEKEWRMISSTLKGQNGKCVDLERQDNFLFKESNLGNGIKQLSWSNSVPGKISLSTVFFAPKETLSSIKLTPVENSPINFLAPQMTSTSALISNYSLQTTDKYDDLKEIFAAVASEKMCISKTNPDTIMIWWNKEYLDNLQKVLYKAIPNKCQ